MHAYERQRAVFVAENFNINIALLQICTPPFHTYSMYTYVLLHFEQKVTSQSLLNFCIELCTAGE